MWTDGQTDCLTDLLHRRCFCLQSVLDSAGWVWVFSSVCSLCCIWQSYVPAGCQQPLPGAADIRVMWSKRPPVSGGRRKWKLVRLHRFHECKTVSFHFLPLQSSLAIFILYMYSEQLFDPMLILQVCSFSNRSTISYGRLILIRGDNISTLKC